MNGWKRNKHIDSSRLDAEVFSTSEDFVLPDAVGSYDRINPR